MNIATRNAAFSKAKTIYWARIEDGVDAFDKAEPLPFMNAVKYIRDRNTEWTMLFRDLYILNAPGTDLLD